MKLKHIVLVTFMLPTIAFAGAIATMPNQAGGKIVLTDEACVHKGKTYNGLNRAYNYGAQGYTTEGCFVVEDETVVVIWDDNTANSKMRYPAENFTLINKNRKPATRHGT
jgi:hypothetical protein